MCIKKKLKMRNMPDAELLYHCLEQFTKTRLLKNSKEVFLHTSYENSIIIRGLPFFSLNKACYNDLLKRYERQH